MKKRKFFAVLLVVMTLVFNLNSYVVSAEDIDIEQNIDYFTTSISSGEVIISSNNYFPNWYENIAVRVYNEGEYDCNLEIGLYDIDEGKMVKTYNCHGYSMTCLFRNLSRTHKYYVSIENHSDNGTDLTVRVF